MKAAFRNRIVCMAALASLGMASEAKASLIAYEGFTSGTGALSAAPANEGGSGSDPLTGAWNATSNSNIESSTLTPNTWASTFPGQPLSGNVVNLNGASTQVDYRAFTSTLPASGDVYMSVLMQREGTTGSGSQTTAFGLYSAIAGTELFEVGALNGEGGFTIDSHTPTSETVNGTSTTPTAIVEVDGNPDSRTNTQLFVVEFDYPDNTVNLWLNPTSNSPSPTTATAVYASGSLPTNVGAIRLASVGKIVDFGEITVGTTFADVVSGVPEPATLALIIPAVVMLTSRRRRPSRQVRQER